MVYHLRPEILYPLFAPLTSLPGIGSRFASVIERLTGPLTVGLLWHLPRDIIDRRAMPRLSEATSGMVATLKIKVIAHQPPTSRRHPYRIRTVTADHHPMTLIFFRAWPESLNKSFPIGQERIISGRIEKYRQGWQMAHPDHVALPEDIDDVRKVEPVYELTAGLSAKIFQRAIRQALNRVPVLPEWLESNFKKKNHWPDWNAAIQIIHKPKTEADLSPLNPLRQRLAYDELLATQLSIALARQHTRRAAGRTLTATGELRARILPVLGFDLTASQRTAIAEIEADLANNGRMVRLLQGDVGSGKTIVAFHAMLMAVEAGTQAALAAPTEILARQHYNTLLPLAQAAGISIILLTGRDKGKPRAVILDGIQQGSISLVIGTHAIFQEDVIYADLGLAVVDEQHRFGVNQRMQLSAKGRGVNILVMTATPIPRTLLLAAYSDLDVSRLTEKPAGRKPIITRAVDLNRLEEIVAAIQRAITDGAQIYWVCPLVEESEQLDLAAAEERYAILDALFPGKVGLVHGRMKGADKDQVMRSFAAAELSILVATTVIEVGVDVPNATIMVVEHAERFGLAQLHQLRGRVGRGGKESTCLLLFQSPLSQTAKARLKIMRDSEDGFLIAEEDLRLRGAGDILGTRQSGLPSFQLADIAVHGDLLAAARDDCRLILANDPGLESPRGHALRILLYLFEKDAVFHTVSAG